MGSSIPLAPDPKGVTPLLLGMCNKLIQMGDPSTLTGL